MKPKYLLFLLVMFVSLSQMLFVLEFPIKTFIDAFCIYGSVIIILVLIFKNYDNKLLGYDLLLKVYLLIGLLSIVRGAFRASNYVEWKHVLLLVGLPLLVPLISFLSNNTKYVQLIFTYYFKYALVFAPIVFIYSGNIIQENIDGFARYVSPIYILILFFSLINVRWKIILVFTVFCSVISDLDARSNLIRICVSFVFSFMMYFGTLNNKKLLESIRLLIFALPFTFFALAYYNIFNIFNMNGYLNQSTSSKMSFSDNTREIDLTADTRTFIYQEVLASVVNDNAIFLGESAAGGYRSYAFNEDRLGDTGRTGSEVGILNVLLYTGILGVFFYSLIFYTASWLAINYSNSFICKIIGLFVAFRWLYSWIEEFTNFDLNYCFLWLIIGVCLSKKFRKMTDKDFQYWVLSIFNNAKKDRKFVVAVHKNSSNQI